MAIKCEGYLIQKTGICAGHYPYRETKEELDNFFLSKKIGEFKDYSVVRADPILTKNINVANIHVDMPHNKLTDVDYVSFKNSNDDRWYHAQVFNREIVNEKSTRLFVIIDYVATFWDTLELMPCLIERSHIPEKEDEDYTTPLNFLDEPFPIKANFQPALTNPSNWFDKYVNTHFKLSDARYCITTSVNKDGSFANPQITFQSGGCVSGFTYVGTKDEIEKTLQLYPRFTSTAINKGSSLFAFIQDSFILPKYASIVGVETSLSVFEGKIDVLADFCNGSYINSLKFKHKKILNYFAFQVVSGGNTTVIDRQTLGLNPFMRVSAIGGSNGCFRADFWAEGVDYNNHAPTTMISTPQWASFSICGNPRLYDYKLDIQKSESQGVPLKYVQAGDKLNGTPKPSVQQKMMQGIK